MFFSDSSLGLVSSQSGSQTHKCLGRPLLILVLHVIGSMTAIDKKARLARLSMKSNPEAFWETFPSSSWVDCGKVDPEP